MTEEWGFAPPPFKPEDALASLRRSLRELGLSEREGKFERRGTLLARAAVEGDVIRAARVRKPSRNSPVWMERTLKSSAEVRDFCADLKKQLALWSDLDD